MSRDPVDILREAASHHRQAAMQQAPELALPSLPHGFRRRVRVRIALATALLGVVAGGAVATAGWLKARQPTRPEIGVMCRTAADPQAEIYLIESTANPIAACGEVWKKGQFETVPAQNPPPALIACVSPEGVAEVLPEAGHTCESLGLSALELPMSTRTVRILRLQEDVVRINGESCLSIADVRLKLQQIRTSAHVSEWPINEPTEQAGCAKAGVDPVREAFDIFLTPKPSGGTP